MIFYLVCVFVTCRISIAVKNLVLVGVIRAKQQIQMIAIWIEEHLFIRLQALFLIFKRYIVGPKSTSFAKG